MSFLTKRSFLLVKRPLHHIFSGHTITDDQDFVGSCAMHFLLTLLNNCHVMAEFFTYLSRTNYEQLSPASKIEPACILYTPCKLHYIYKVHKDIYIIYYNYTHGGRVMQTPHVDV